MGSQYLDRPLRSLDALADSIRDEIDRCNRQAVLLEREARRLRLLAQNAERQLEGVEEALEHRNVVVVKFPDKGGADYLALGADIMTCQFGDER